jgi:16S rRNA (cytidine1402-2'-O)-methyltransferase
MGVVYLIPAPLDELALSPIPAYILSAIKSCAVFFVENERTTRRFFKKLDSSIVIDDYTWYNMEKGAEDIRTAFIKEVRSGKNIGVVSEAGCPGIADPGQLLVELAHQEGVTVKPLVGPSSILLALMASGFNGQQFAFHGYLPVDDTERMKKIKSLEEQSAKTKTTQIFIETPYRNDKLLAAILKTAHPKTRLCVAVSLTSENENIWSMTVGEWKKNIPLLHKQPAIFLLQSSS